MRRVFTVICTVLCTVACKSPVQNLTVDLHNTIGDLDSVYVFVRDTAYNRIMLASAPVIDSIAKLTIPVSKTPRLAKIGMERWQQEFILEPGDLKVGLTPDHNWYYEGGNYNQKAFGYLQGEEMQQVYEGRKNASTREEHYVLNEKMFKIRGDNCRMMCQSTDPYDNILGYALGGKRNEAALAALDSLRDIVGEGNTDLEMAAKSCEDNIRIKKIKESLCVGAQLPDFDFVTIDGKNGKISEVYSAKKVTLVDFWASWCVPCRNAIEALKPIYAKYSSKGFEAVSFSIDDKEEAWRDASEKINMAWINCSADKDGRKVVTDRFAITSIPTLFVVDNTGKIMSESHSLSDLEAILKKI